MRRGSIIALLVIAALPYLTGLRNGFVYDDHGSIEDNPFLRNPANVSSVLTLRTLADPSIPDGRRPVVVASYFLDRALWRLDPFGYHVTDLALHLANVLLVFGLVRRLVKPENHFLPFAAALLFAIQPVAIEAVQVPAFREDPLSTCFILLYLLAALARPPFTWLSIPALLLGLLSKESAAVAPAILLWLGLCMPERRQRQSYAMVLTASVAICVVFVVFWFRAGPPQAVPPNPAAYALAFPQNLLTAPWLAAKAFRLLAVPWPLLADYVIAPVRRFSDVRFIAGSGLTILAAAGALILRRRLPLVALGLGWMLIAFLPTSNIVPLFNPFAERYLYFMAIGSALILAVLLGRIPRPQLRSGILAAICVTYVAVAIPRIRDWSNDFTLWSATLRHEPDSSRANTWLGLDFKKRGEFETALAYFETADRLNPRDTSALINIAIICGQQGRLAEAEKLLREAVRRRPDKAEGHWNLAVALQQQGKTNEAMAEVQRTLAIDPWNPAALAAKGRPADDTSGR